MGVKWHDNGSRPDSVGIHSALQTVHKPVHGSALIHRRPRVCGHNSSGNE